MANKNIEFDYHKFSSGLRLVTVPMESTKTVTIFVLVGTGSRYEDRRINGISHFLEHMMFKGTEKRPEPMEIAERLDEIGAEYNAFTSHEYTGYYIKANYEKFDLAFDIISDIFLNSKFDEKEIEKEKGVIVEEINMYKDSPARQVGDLFLELIYGDQPLGWAITGPKETVIKLKKDDFRKYFDSHYSAQNTVIGIAGNINPLKIKKEVEKTFKNIRKQEKINAKPVKENQKKPQIKIEFKKTDQTHFHLGFRAFGRSDKRKAELAVLSAVLGGGMSSRLWSEVREKRGLAYYVRAGSDMFSDTGIFSANAGVDNKRVVTAIEVILKEFKKLKEEEISEKELAKAKDFIKGKTAIGLESSDDLADFYVEQELLMNKIETVDEKMKKIEAVTRKDIKELANSIFVPERLNLALIGPFKQTNKDINKIIKMW